MRFVETPIFMKVIGEFLDDEDYRALQSSPDAASRAKAGREGLGRRTQGALEPGRCREARQPAGAVLRGASAVGGLYAYAKNEQGDLTPAQVRALAALVRQEFT
jgi:hypothetical protein